MAKKQRKPKPVRGVRFPEPDKVRFPDADKVTFPDPDTVRFPDKPRFPDEKPKRKPPKKV